MDESKITRVRMGFKVSAGGVFQTDITSEAPTVSETAENLRLAVAELNKIAAAEGYTLKKV